MEIPTEITSNTEINTFEEKSRILINKLGLTDGIPNLDKVIETSKNIIEKYKVPESFQDDEINMMLLLGCSQKLTEDVDPRYLKRSEGLIKRLISPVIEKGIIDEDELWGLGPDRGGLDKKQVKEYINSKIDSEATSKFLETHKESLNKAKEVWKSKGYDLDIEVKIVSDDIYEFRHKTRSGGFINVPSKDELSKDGGKAEIKFVLLKGYSDKDNFVRHELYHIEDYWGYIRRGYQGSILESLDELHTEYSAGNYDENHSGDPHADSNYFTLKQFWDKLSYVGDLDFNIIKDRSATIQTIAENFGLDGLIDFTLMYAHGDGKFSIFETFYSDEERPILDMLISKEMLNLKKLQNPKNLNSTILETVQNLDKLKDLMSPIENHWYPKYKSIYELIPSKDGKVYSANSGEVRNEDAKQEIIAYTRALAMAELIHRGEIKIDDVLYKEMIGALDKIPYHRPSVDFSVDSYIKKEYERNKEFTKDDNELNKDIYSGLYLDLVYNMESVDFAFSLQNPITKNQILNHFFAELDLLAKHCVDTQNIDFQKWFVNGLYSNKITLELRDSSADYLIDNFPNLKPLVEARRSSFDARKAVNFSP